MAATIQAIFPNDGQTGVPIRADIEITFDVGMDLSSVIKNIAVYGADFDRTSGPDSALWIDGATGANPFFLSSPGYQGKVECSMSLEYVDSGTGVAIDPQPEYLDQTEETADAYYQKVKLTPSSALAPDTEYTVYLVGDAETGTDHAISSRTVFDIDGSAATSTTGIVYVYGGYTGDAQDKVRIKITTAGDIGTAKYKWWYADTEVEGDARTGKLTSRRYRRLEDGLQVRFSGSGFLVDDIYDVVVYPVDYLAASYSFSFTTGSGAIEAVPSTASTSVIGTVTSVATEYLTVLSMIPEDGSWHQAFEDNTITITFSEDLDASTVTDDTVTVYSYPISGDFSGGPSSTSFGPYTELFKKLTVSTDTLTIEL